MRRTGPFLIFIIGLIALVVDFAPNLRIPEFGPEGGTRVIETKLGLDLKGGLRVEYRAEPAGGRAPGPDDLAIIRNIVEARVNTTGASEPVVTTQGSDRIVVELPDITDPEAARTLVGQTGQLAFVPIPPGSPVPAEDTVIEYPALFLGDKVASATIGQDQQGQRAVNFVLNPEGAALFERHTTEHVGEYFAITLDNRVITAPVINSAIPGGNVQITQNQVGGYPLKDAQNLVTILKFGSLPFPITELSNENISATLGQLFLDRSLVAGAIGIHRRGVDVRTTDDRREQRRLAHQPRADARAPEDCDEDRVPALTHLRVQGEGTGRDEETADEGRSRAEPVGHSPSQERRGETAPGARRRREPGDGKRDTAHIV